MSKLSRRFNVRSSMTCVAGAVLAALSGMEKAKGQNTPTLFTTSAADLSAGTNYRPAITPTAASTYDVEFSGTYATLPFDVNGAALSFGTLNDVTTQALAITNSNAMAGSITLSSPGNSVSSTVADLIYVASGANLNISNGAAGGNTLVIGATGNIDDAGALAIYGPLSLTAGNTVTFTGTGTTTINGSIGSTTAALALGNSSSVVLTGSRHM